MFVFCCRMQAFTNVREWLDDVQMSSPVAVGLAKLVLLSCLMLNFLGGVWYVCSLSWLAGSLRVVL